MAYEDMSINITQPTANNYYALLFVGTCNRERYVLSLIRWTNLLHEMYGYPLANIRIVVGTYSDPSWDPMVAGTDVTYDATMADLDNALEAYAAGSGDPLELGSDDNLFIFTFNHGGEDASGCYLCCENFGANYYASDFATRIGAIQCNQIVLLAAQCHAGGFVDPFINALSAGTRGAVMAGCRSDQNTYEAIFDKLFASAFNGRMVQDPVDDNIDLGISYDDIDVYAVPGYHEDRIDWGPTGVISTREAFNWVYDHYVNEIYPDPAYSSVAEIPLYKQEPWMESGQPLHIRLGEPDLVMQDCSTDSGVEASTCASPWHSPDLYADNTDQFPTATQHQYVPAHHNRFFVRTANRGTAPTDDIWRCIEVRGLGFTGGPVGPPRIDRAVETTVSARLRPGRAHTQYQRILIGDDFGHGCVSAAAWCGTDPMSHNLWQIINDNDQVQCNLNPAAVSGSVPVTSGSVNSNAGKIVQLIPITADADGTFELRVGKPKADFSLIPKVEKKSMKLKKGQISLFKLEIIVEGEVKDGAKGQLTVTLLRGGKVIGGVTFLLTTATAFARVAVFNSRSLPVPGAEVILWQPGDPRKLTAKTDKRGIATFGPLNPGFYFTNSKGIKQPKARAFIAAGKDTIITLAEGRPVKQVAQRILQKKRKR
jgi:hypothetical protein